MRTYTNYIYTYIYIYSIGNSTSLLEPALLTSTVLQHIDTLYTFIQLPGIHNCATKMLNGIECGNNNILINYTHIDIAKDILLRFVYFGITEHFHTSICMMSWLYGGSVHPYHFKVWRKGNYGSGGRGSTSSGGSSSGSCGNSSSGSTSGGGSSGISSSSSSSGSGSGSSDGRSSSNRGEEVEKEVEELGKEVEELTSEQ